MKDSFNFPGMKTAILTEKFDGALPPTKPAWQPLTDAEQVKIINDLFGLNLK